MKKKYLRLVSVLLIATLCISLVTACGSSETAPEPSPAPVDNTDNAVAPIEPLVEEDPVVEGLSIEQRSSMAMLNYLAYVVQEIHESSRSGLTLARIYDELVNGIEPSNVDDVTRQAFNNISATVAELERTDRGFNRLSFLSGQDKAQTILSEVLPIVISTVSTFSEQGPKVALASLAYSTIDTVANLDYVSAEELLYLERGWALEDDEAAAIMKSRAGMFDYMVQIAQGLPSGITLNEDDLKNYIEKTTKSGTAAKLDWLERNQEKYQYFGYYWLDLADAYYENKDFEKCLAAIETYRANDTGIFKLDKRLAKSLALAILSAEEVLEGKAFENVASEYADTIAANIGSEDWELRFYAATAYYELYKDTQNVAYLEKAYKELKDNVQNLVPVQIEQNHLYVEEVIEAKANEDADKEETSLIKEYNKYLKAQRKIELPPVYGPLLSNCELLFKVADDLKISDGEKKVIDSILHDEPVFLSYELDKKFSYNKTSSIPGLSRESLSYSGVLADQKFTLPALLAPAGTSVSGEAIISGQTIALENWSVNEVDRNKSKDVNDFEAVFTCKAPKTIVFKTGDTITLTLTPPGADAENDVITIKMVVDKLTVGVPHFSVESITPEF